MIHGGSQFFAGGFDVCVAVAVAVCVAVGRIGGACVAGGRVVAWTGGCVADGGGGVLAVALGSAVVVADGGGGMSDVAEVVTIVDGGGEADADGNAEALAAGATSRS